VPADQVRVVLLDGKEFTAKIIGTDPHTDLAVVKVDGATLSAITVTDSDNVDRMVRLSEFGEKVGEGTGGAPAGDLLLRVRLAAHPEFRAHGIDLYHDLEIAPWESVLGATATVPTLCGGQVKLRIPAAATTWLLVAM
jgi:curved DNA-binding protein